MNNTSSSVAAYHYGGTAVNGWTCGNCGAWVASGITHTCTWRWTYQPYPYSPLSDEDIERIAKRVAELLRKKKA